MAMEEMNTNIGEVGTGGNTTNNLITVSIKQLDGSLFGISIPPGSTVRELKLAIQRERGIAMERQRLIYRAQELKNEGNLLTDYGIVHNSTLHIVIRPLGSSSASAAGAGAGADVDAAQSPRDAIINIPQNQVDVSYIGNPNGEGILVMDGNMSHHSDVNVLHIVKLCRFVRIFAIIDFIFLLLFGLTVSPFFFIMAGLALAGYYGAKVLRRGYLIAYMICLILEIAGRGYFIYADNSSVLSIILFVLMICIELFVLRCVIQLYKAIGHLDGPTRERAMALNRAVF